jgi:hypothetical protein
VKEKVKYQTTRTAEILGLIDSTCTLRCARMPYKPLSLFERLEVLIHPKDIE